MFVFFFDADLYIYFWAPSNIVIAETDKYETVEGNVYVSWFLLFLNLLLNINVKDLHLTFFSFPPTPSKRSTSNLVALTLLAGGKEVRCSLKRYTRSLQKL